MPAFFVIALFLQSCPSGLGPESPISFFPVCHSGLGPESPISFFPVCHSGLGPESPISFFLRLCKKRSDKAIRQLYRRCALFLGMHYTK